MREIPETGVLTGGQYAQLVEIDEALAAVHHQRQVVLELRLIARRIEERLRIVHGCRREAFLDDGRQRGGARVSTCTTRFCTYWKLSWVSMAIRVWWFCQTSSQASWLKRVGRCRKASCEKPWVRWPGLAGNRVLRMGTDSQTRYPAMREQIACKASSNGRRNSPTALSSQKLSTAWGRGLPVSGASRWRRSRRRRPGSAAGAGRRGCAGGRRGAAQLLGERIERVVLGLPKQVDDFLHGALLDTRHG